MTGKAKETGFCCRHVLQLRKCACFASICLRLTHENCFSLKICLPNNTPEPEHTEMSFGLQVNRWPPTFPFVYFTPLPVFSWYCVGNRMWVWTSAPFPNYITQHTGSMPSPFVLLPFVYSKDLLNLNFTFHPVWLLLSFYFSCTRSACNNSFL